LSGNLILQDASTARQEAGAQQNNEADCLKRLLKLTDEAMRPGRRPAPALRQFQLVAETSEVTQISMGIDVPGGGIAGKHQQPER
jgi:hypothetical protein